MIEGIMFHILFFSFFGQLVYHFVGFYVKKRKNPDMNYNPHYFYVLILAAIITVLIYAVLKPDASPADAFIFGLTANSWTNKLIQILKL